MDEYFKIYELDSYNYIANPVVINTVNQNNNFAFVESYILIPKADNTIFPNDQSIKHPTLGLNTERFANAFKDSKIGYDHAKFLEVEGFKQAKYTLVTLFLEKAKELGIRDENWHIINLVETNHEKLMSLWMHRQCKEDLLRLRDNTQNQTLIDTLDIIYRLPKIAHK